jgi:hypothetical protein
MKTLSVLITFVALQLTASFFLPPHVVHRRFAATSRRDEVDLSTIEFCSSDEQTRAQEIVAERLKTFLQNRTTVLEGLTIHVAPTKKTQLISGFMPPVKFAVSKVAVKQLSASGGAVIFLTRVNFRVPWLLRRYFKPSAPAPRPLRRQMQLSVDMMLTVDDVVESAMVRGLVERLVNIIVNKPIESLGGEGSRVSKIDRVDIKNGRFRVSRAR